MEGTPTEKKATPVLSSAKREDIWALVIAVAVMALSMAAPEAVYTFFKKTLYFF